MTNDQKIVARGAASGVAAMALIVWLLTTQIPAPDIPNTSADRIAYALPWGVVAALPLFFMIVAVGNARFLGKAIDSTLGQEHPSMLVDGRVADNTTQQFLLFVIAMMGLAVTVPAGGLSVIPAVAITFVISRVVFWIGYRIHPLYRAPGFASTAYLNLGMIVATLWMWVD